MDEQEFLDAIEALILRTTGQEVSFGSINQMDDWFEDNEDIGDLLQAEIDALDLSDEAYWGEGQAPAVAQINRESSLSGGGQIGDPHPKMESRFFEENLSSKDIAMMSVDAASLLPFGLSIKAGGFTANLLKKIGTSKAGYAAWSAGVNVASNLPKFTKLLHPRNIWGALNPVNTLRWIGTGSRTAGAGAFSVGGAAIRGAGTYLGYQGAQGLYGMADEAMGGILPNILGWGRDESEEEIPESTPEEATKIQQLMDEAAATYHMENNVTFGQAAVNFAQFLVEGGGTGSGQSFQPSDTWMRRDSDGTTIPIVDPSLSAQMGISSKSLLNSEFREQWESHWRTNWSGNTIYKEQIVDHLLDVIEKAGITEAVGPGGQTLTRADGVAFLNQVMGQGAMIQPYVDEAVRNFTDELRTQGITEVLVTPTTYTDPEGGQQNTFNYTLMNYSALPDISDGNIFDLTSNGKVNSLNVETQLQVLDPILYEQVKRQLDAYGFYPEGVNARNANLEQVQFAYTQLHNTILQIHAEDMMTYDSSSDYMPMKQGQVRNALVRQRILPTQQVNTDARRDFEEDGLISDVSMGVQRELANMGYNTGNEEIATSINNAVTSAIRKDSSNRRVGSTYERDLAETLLKEFHGPGATPTFGPNDSPSASIIQANKYGHLNPEVRALINGGQSTYQAWKGIRDENFIDTAVDTLISYLPSDGQPVQYSDFADAFNTYLWVNGGSRAGNMSASDIESMTNNVWSQVQEKNTEVDDYSQNIVEGIGMKDYGSPEMWEAFEIMNQAGRGGRAVTRSRV